MAFSTKKKSNQSYDDDNNLPATQDDSDQYAIMTMREGELKMMLRDTIGTEKLTANDLVRVTVPSRGSTTWMVPTIEGEKPMKAIEGIIVLSQNVRAYWKQSFEDSGGGTPPDCVSRDGLIGEGEPGGECLSCEYSQWKSDKKGRGKACSESRLIYLLTKDQILPIVIKVPATSLASARKYLFGIVSTRVNNKMTEIHSVYTKITLEKASNVDGIDYSKMVFEKTGDVENPEVSKKYSEDLKPFLETSIDQLTKEQDPIV